MEVITNFKLIVGAWSIPLELEEAHSKGLHAALYAVYPKLLDGTFSAQQAVVECV